MVELSKAEQTRNFIIESTADVFNKKGFAGTSLSDLTKATGLTKGSIYGNFENKEEVALAVFDYNYNKVTQHVQEQMDNVETAHDKLMVYCWVYRKITRATVNHGGCPILNTAIDSDDTHPLLTDKAAKAVAKWEKNLAKIISDGIKTGEFKKDIIVRQMSLSLIALIEGGVMISRLTKDPTSMDNVLSTFEMLVSHMKR